MNGAPATIGRAFSPQDGSRCARNVPPSLRGEWDDRYACDGTAIFAEDSAGELAREWFL